MVCGGKPHVHKVRVNAQGRQFSRGTASVSAFVSLLDPATQTTVQGHMLARSASSGHVEDESIG